MLEKFKGKKIALYGLGANTQKFICETGDFFDIVGLLDGFRTEGELYGKKIIDFNNCAEFGVELIIVVARPGSCKAIAKKISKACEKSGIELYDVHGKNLVDDTHDYFTYSGLLDYISEEMDISDIRVQLFTHRLNEIVNKSDEYNKGHLCIDNPYDIGYLFCAPIITDFVLWMRDYVKNSNIQNVLMCARDGYLIDRLYRRITSEKACTYFYTSRTAAIRAGVSDKADLEYVDSMKFSGSLEKNIYERFGIYVNGCGLANDWNGAVRFQGEILKRAKRLKMGYKKYVDTLSLKEGDTALFDFVAKGTTQYYLERIIENKLIGLYFLQPEPDSMKDKNLDIVTFYTKEELETSVIYNSYYILETVLTSSEPSVSEISENGIPVFGEETRDMEAIRCSEIVQKGIEDYFSQYIEAAGNKYTIDKQADELFLRLMNNVEIVSDKFLNMVIEDPFFNRATKVMDVL